MTYFILIGSLITGWAVLRVFGGERENRLQAVRETIKTETAQALALEEAARAAEEANLNPDSPANVP